MEEVYSAPTILLTAKNPDGSRVIFDDFRETYAWIKDNTPADAKVLAWWDYGYHLNALANRTTIVDNNTWNTTHIARVAQALASSENDALPILRELDVDYVMVVFGGLTGYASDDLKKFVWMLRIAASVPSGAHIKVLACK